MDQIHVTFFLGKILGSWFREHKTFFCKHALVYWIFLANNLGMFASRGVYLTRPAATKFDCFNG